MSVTAVSPAASPEAFPHVTSGDPALPHPAARAHPARRVRRRVVVGNSGRFTITTNFQDSDCPQTLANTDGKEIITKHPRSVTAEFGVNYKMIAAAMLSGEIPDDVKTLLQQLMDLCKL